MFDIGWGELVIIGIVALIVIGPKELPGVLRMLGQWMGKVRRMAADFQGQWNEAMREAEMEDLKKQVDQITDSARDFTNFDPVETARKEIESAVEDKPKTEPSPEPSPAAPESAPGAPGQPALEPVSEREFLGFGDDLDKINPSEPAAGGGRAA
jgi:sec-independent protein translocase protein TatB